SEGINLASLKNRNLRDQMRCSSKSVDSHSLRVARLYKRAISDQARAQQRRRFNIGKDFRDRHTKAFVCADQFRVSAVLGISGKLWCIAEIFPAFPAEF